MSLHPAFSSICHNRRQVASVWHTDCDIARRRRSKLPSERGKDHGSRKEITYQQEHQPFHEKHHDRSSRQSQTATGREIGQAGFGEAGFGEAGLGEAGLGKAGLGKAGLGEASSGEAGNRLVQTHAVD
jgi:hypothetical protein